MFSAAFSFEGFVSLDDEFISHGPVKLFIVKPGHVCVCFDNGSGAQTTAAYDCCVYCACSLSVFLAILIVFQCFHSSKPRLFIVSAVCCVWSSSVRIFGPGRYAVNSPSFSVDSFISTQQQVMKLSQHTVMLAGGITLNVTGIDIHRHN
jgi:hypothetical protein